MLISDQNRLNMPLVERAKVATHPLAQRLLALITRKKSNLCIAVDTQSSSELISLAEKVRTMDAIFSLHLKKSFTEKTLSFKE